MAICPADCTAPLVQNPQEACKEGPRLITPSRFIFWGCNVAIPDPITPENIAPLFEDGSIVASRELAEFIPAAPTYEEVRVADCRPALRYVSTREIAFRDLFAVTGQSGSPAATDPYFDYDFWQDKVDSAGRLRYGIVFCDGDTRLARDANGNFLTADITAFLDYIRPTNGGSSTEFKNINIRFQGDPLALTNKPEFNIIEAGIIL